MPTEDPETEASVPSRKEETPLEPGRPMDRDESVERMYARFDKTFEALAK